MAVQIIRWQFTVDDYQRMLENGILSEDDRVELIDGEVRAMTPIGSLHAAVVNRLNDLLVPQLTGSAIVSVQNPIRLSGYTEPQPGLAVLRWRADFYAGTHPTPDDVLIVIEVADTSLAYDRVEKLPRYAEAGIPEVWIVNLTNQTIEQYTQPENGVYREQQVFTGDQMLYAEGVAGLTVPIEGVFV